MVFLADSQVSTFMAWSPATGCTPTTDLFDIPSSLTHQHTRNGSGHHGSQRRAYQCPKAKFTEI